MAAVKPQASKKEIMLGNPRYLVERIKLSPVTPFTNMD